MVNSNFVSCKLNKIINIEILEKNIYKENDSKYRFGLTTNINNLYSKGEIILLDYGNGIYKELFSNTIIHNVYSLDLDASTKKDYIEKYQEYLESPLCIYEVRQINKEKINYQNLENSFNTFTSIFNIAQNNLKEQNQHIIDEDKSYKNSIKQKKLGKRGLI